MVANGSEKKNAAQLTERRSELVAYYGPGDDLAIRSPLSTQW